MNIHLKEAEIHQALIEFIGNLGFDTSGKAFAVNLIAGRGANGHSADIEVTNAEDVTEDSLDDSQQAIEFSFQQAE